MVNFDLQSDEVVLQEAAVTCKSLKGTILLTLTSQKIVLEREKGFFKKERELIEIIMIESIKVYNNEAQVKHKGNMVDIQTINENISFAFAGMLEARRFAGKVIDTVTGTTLAQRSSERVKNAFGVVDDALGLDTRGAIKGIIENGVKGTILNGIGKKK